MIQARPIRPALLAAAALLLAASGPAAPQPSAAVTLARLHTGSLPRTVQAYGSVQPRISAQETVMAPLAAVVRQVFVQQGAMVAAHAPLLRLAPSPAAVEAYARARSAARVATELVGRTRRMVAQHLATAQQLAQAEQSVSDAQASLAALRAEGADGPQDLRAAAAAIVAQVSVRPGAIVTPGTRLVLLTQPQGLVLKAGIVPADARAIAPGNTATIRPVGARRAIHGTVLLRGAMIDPQSGLVPVEISFPPGAMLGGEIAEARITTGTVSGYVVPHAAILADPKGAPYVVQAVHMVAHEVAVRVLASDGRHDVIAGKLDPAAPLVVAGNYQLENGMHMRLADPKDAAAQ